MATLRLFAAAAVGGSFFAGGLAGGGGRLAGDGLCPVDVGGKAGGGGAGALLGVIERGASSEFRSEDSVDEGEGEEEEED